MFFFFVEPEAIKQLQKLKTYLFSSQLRPLYLNIVFIKNVIIIVVYCVVSFD